MVSRIILFIFLFYYAAVSSQEQHVIFEHYSAESELASSFVRGMMQDRQGFVWFGTLNTINRFDGFNFKKYEYESLNKSLFTKGYVNVIYEDSRGDFWIGTQGGLIKHNRNTGEIVHYSLNETVEQIYKFDIQFVHEDNSGELWIGTMMGLYNPDTAAHKLNRFKSDKYKDLISNLAFRSFSQDNEGNMWFGTGIGLIKYDKELKEMELVWVDPNVSLLNYKNWNTVDYATQSIFKDESGTLWVGSLGGMLLNIHPDKGLASIFNLKDTVSLENYPIQSICSEDENKLWIATFKGLLLVDKNTGTIIQRHVHKENIKESISDNKLTSVMKDSSGTLWIATLTGGLNKLNRTIIPFKNLQRSTWATDKAYSQVPFSDMVISRKGTILAGTADGIEEIKPGFKEVIIHEPRSAVNTLLEDSKGNLWIALKQHSGGGLYRKDVHGKLFTITDTSGSFFYKEIQCIYETRNGRIFFSSNFNLYEIDAGKDKAFLMYNTDKRINKLGEDVNNILCLGTLSGGLYLFDPVSMSVIKHFIPNEKDSSRISDNSISEIFLDSHNRLWLGTSLGLSRYNRENDAFTLYENKFGRAHNLIYKILEDNSGNLWLGTSIGISKFNPETEIFKNYDISYGLISGPHYIGGRSSDGELYFKAGTGITYFHPDSIMDNSYIPPIVISEMKVLNSSYPVADEIELSYSENYISLEFAALSYVSPEKNMFAYKMEGVDEDWVYSNNRRYVSYTSLEPGKYIFRVKGSNNDGLWNDAGSSMVIIINPPWYKTFWAYSLYIILTGIVFYGWRKYDLKRENLKYQLKLEHENVQRQEEVSRIKTRFFTNISHEFRTPLTLILGPAEEIISSYKDSRLQKNAGMIKKNASQLLKLVNQLLDIAKIDEGKVKLRVSNGELVSFVKGIVMIFEPFAEKKDIILKVISERNSIDSWFDKEKIEKVLINIVSNAIKFTNKGCNISVYISSDGKKAEIKVKDTGIGISSEELPKIFDRFYQANSSLTREYEGTGIGLALTKELIELHHGSIFAESTPGKGTEFTFIFPIDRKFYSDEEMSDEPHKQMVLPEMERTNGNGLSDALSTSKFYTDDDKPILLIVEDNEDVRRFIRSSLENEYQIEEAANGEQGFRKAEQLIPDLIISDIMMPLMDGYEFTGLIRNNEKTNHIPVLLLTAKSDRESRLEGLELGADDFIVKPFDKEELRIRILNLIKIRKQLQKKFASGEKAQLKNDDKKFSYLNEKFINKVIEVMDKHINEEDFSIEEFSRELCMSRAQLHRKLKALTGKSASRYLRSYRLNAARKMIEKHQNTISEIAYCVGFSSPDYFSKCFKDEYGYSPSEHSA